MHRKSEQESGELMSYESETPFASIENSLEYMELLAESVAETHRDVKHQLFAAEREGITRRRDALTIVALKLEILNRYVVSSHRLLNDLRTLRRLLLEERTSRTTAGIKA